MWAFHFHGWGYHTGLGWIQHHRQNGKLRWRSQRIDGTFLWHRTKFFGCKIVRKEFRTVMTSNSIVRAHSFFRLIMDFNQMSKYSLFAFFAWNMLSLTSSIIALQFQLVKYISFCSLRSAWLTNENSSFIFSIFKVGWCSNTLETALLCFVSIWMVTFLSMICEPGTRVTNQFEVFEDELGQCDWYLLSIGMQRMYAIFLLDTQYPIELLSYVNITCARETLKKVVHCMLHSNSLVLICPFPFPGYQQSVLIFYDISKIQIRRFSSQFERNAVEYGCIHS